MDLDYSFGTAVFTWLINNVLENRRYRCLLINDLQQQRLTIVKFLDWAPELKNKKQMNWRQTNQDACVGWNTCAIRGVNKDIVFGSGSEIH